MDATVLPVIAVVARDQREVAGAPVAAGAPGLFTVVLVLGWAVGRRTAGAGRGGC